MGRLFVVSAPSGSGKSTLCRRLLEVIPRLSYSVSCTSRPPRPGEIDGRDYFFVSREQFQEMIRQKSFLEWAEVFGRFYGTPRKWVTDKLAEGQDVLVDVDVAGARQIRTTFPEAVFIFVLPPNLSELRRRLKARHTETEEQIDERLNQAREEIKAKELYEYLVINDDLEQAVADLACLVRADRLRLSRAGDFRPVFFNTGK